MDYIFVLLFIIIIISSSSSIHCIDGIINTIYIINNII